MRLEQLEYLVDIYKTKSMTVTAERFFVSQQAVSNNIKLLEKEVGTTLLIRNPHGVNLTPDGKMLVDFAERTLKDFQETLRNFNAEENTAFKSFIRIGSASLLNSILMPKIISTATHGSYEYVINVQETIPTTLLQKIQAQEYDIGIMTINEGTIKLLQEDDEFKSLWFDILLRDQLVACMNTNSSYAKQEYLTRDQINTYWKALCGIYPIEQYERIAIERSVICTNDVLLCRKLLLRKDIFVLMPQLIYTKFFKGKKFVAKPLDVSQKIIEAHCLIYRKPVKNDVAEFVTLVKNSMRQI